MYRVRWAILPAMGLLVAPALCPAPAYGQAAQDKTPSERVQEMFHEMHTMLSCLQLQLTDEQANLIIEQAPGVRAKREALEMRHEEHLQPLLPDLTRAVEMMRAGKVQEATKLAEDLRKRLELVEEDLQAGLAAVADSLKPAYLKLTEKQRAEVFDEFFPRSGSERALDEFMAIKQEERDNLKADYAVYLVQQSATQSPDGKMLTADAEKVFAVFDKAAKLTPEQYQAQRQGLVNEMVALLPQGDGLQRSALQSFVEFMATPDLELIVQRAQRMGK